MAKSKGKIPSALGDANEAAIPAIRRFVLARKTDVSGTSGTGYVAAGVVFPSGACCLSWLSIVSSLGIFHSLADLEKIHGHEGETYVKFLDE